MNDEVMARLKRLLGATDKDVGFVEYLPSDTAEALTQSIQKRLEAERETLRAAIAKGIEKLPAPLAAVARRTLA